MKEHGDKGTVTGRTASSPTAGRWRGATTRLLALGTMLALVAVACGGGGEAEPTNTTGGGDTGGETTVAAEPAEGLTDEQVATMEEIGLNVSQPYAGTTLSFLLCCQTAAQFATIIEKTAEFTEMTGIEVEFVDVDYGSFQQRLTAAAVTGEVDLVAWIDAWGPSIASALVPLDDRLEAVGRSMDEFPAPYADVVAAGDPEGRVLGLPLRGHPFLSFYRTDILEEVGAEIPATWEEYEALARTVAAETDIPATDKYYSSTGGQNIFEWVARMWSKGGDFFDENGQPTINSPEVVEATDDYVTYIRDGLTPDGAINWGEGEALTEFVEGRGANFNGWWWMYGNMVNEEIAVDDVLGNVEFAPAPAYEDGEPVTYAYLWPMGILNQSANVDAAWEYLNWVTNEQVALDVLLASEDPGGAVHLNTQQDEEANELFDGLLAEGGEILSQGRALPMIAQWPQVQDIIAVALNDIAAGADTQERLDQANEEISGVVSG